MGIFILICLLILVGAICYGVGYEGGLKCGMGIAKTVANNAAEVMHRDHIRKDEHDSYVKAAPLCEKHQPSGGARSGCLVCAGIKLSAALSRIDYIIGAPNEYQICQYDADCDEDGVVKRVEKAIGVKL